MFHLNGPNRNKALRDKNSWLQCYSVQSDILVKIEVCKPLERGSNVLSTGNRSKLKLAVLFCSIYEKIISFSALVF